MHNNPSKKNYNIHLIYNNIGPLSKGNLQYDSDNFNILIYANNGTGKSFLSRCFEKIDAKINNRASYYDNNLLNMEANDGYFKFIYKNKDIKNTQRFNLKKDSEINYINLDNNIILHVFNSDYIRTNFIQCNYNLNNNIEGEIYLAVVGADNASIEKLKQQSQKLTEDNKKIKLYIEKVLEDTKKDICKKYKIKSNTQNLLLFDFDKIINDKIQYIYTIEDLDKQYNAIKDYNENADNYQQLSQLNPNFDLGKFNDIKQIISTSYTKKSISENFLNIIEKNKNFIKDGLSITSDNMCPYCNQSLLPVKDLIDAYNNYFDKTQIEIEKILNNNLIKLDNTKNLIHEINKQIISNLNLFNKQKFLFSNTKDIEITQIAIDENFFDKLESIKQEIEDKKNNITKTDFNLEALYKSAQDSLDKFIDKIKQFNTNIDILEKAKNSSKAEMTEIRKNICLSTLVFIKQNNKELIEEYHNNIKNLISIEEEIRQKSSTKKCKDEMYKIFTECIQVFFGDKYSVEKDTFKIIFKNTILNNPINHLSDGEKTLISFCYYIASINQKISRVEDYDKLIFIIDDPISSLDYEYIYKTADFIKNINEYIKEIKEPKYIILTHNIEFYNILLGNKIIKTAYYLTKEKLKKADSNFIFPYEAHLKAIYNVANKVKVPDYTIPNSIRHILEAIKNFEAPDLKNLMDFVNEKELFKNNPSVNIFINDLSHGRIRSFSIQQIESDVTQACKELIEYIKIHYMGQINKISK